MVIELHTELQNLLGYMFFILKNTFLILNNNNKIITDFIVLDFSKILGWNLYF